MPATPAARRHQRHRGGPQVPGRQRRARRAASASTRAPATPATTWATCGGATAPCSARSPSPPRRPRAGSRPTSPRPSRSTAGQTYVVSYHAPAGRYSGDAEHVRGRRRRPAAAARPAQRGRRRQRRLPLRAASGFPDRRLQRRPGTASTWCSSTPPARPSSQPTPAADATGVATDAQVAATFGEPVDDRQPDRSRCGTTPPGQASAARGPTTPPPAPPPSRPRRPWPTAHTFTARVNGARDAAGNAMAAPHAWSFTTVAGGVLSFWTAATVPGGDRGQRRRGHRGRHQVPGRRRRLGRRRPVLQGRRQHRHPRRQRVAVRRRAARPGDLHRRDGHRAGSRPTSPAPVAVVPGHHLRRVVLRPAGPLRGQRRLLLDARASTTA